MPTTVDLRYTARALERPTAEGHSQHTAGELRTVCERGARKGGAWVAGWSSRTPPSPAGVVASPLGTVGGSASSDATRGGVRNTGGRAPTPARRGASGPRRARRPCRHIAVVHFADLPPLHQVMQRTGDRPLGEAGGLAHLGRPEPLRPRGRQGRQDLPLTTGGAAGGGGPPGPGSGARGAASASSAGAAAGARWAGTGVPRAWRSFSHSIAAMRSASARENAAP